MLAQVVIRHDISMERETRPGLLCNFHEWKSHHSDSTSWSWPRRRTVRRSATWLWRVYLLCFSVQVESTLGSKGDQLVRVQATPSWTRSWQTATDPGSMAWICTVLMPRLIYGPGYGIKTNLSWPSDLGWGYLDQKLVPVLSQVAPAPVSILQLVECNCQKSMCSRKVLVQREQCGMYQKLCKCGGEGDDCTNSTPQWLANI